jgi:inorganic phosphate transporter, PiT family
MPRGAGRSGRACSTADLIDATTAGLVVVAAAFAVVNGVNDGGTLVANGLKIRTLRLSSALGLLTLGVAATPLVLGTRVADTLATRLVDLDAPGGQRTLAVAIVAAVAVVGVLARLGLPTSLTLATIGGLAGSGFGAGLVVQWHTVGVVLLLAAVAPLVGTALAFGLARLSGRLTAPTTIGRLVGHGHRAAFTLQCVAYGANDGQKMLAVAVLALGLSDVGGLPLAGLLAGLSLLFLVGTVVGVRRMAGTLGTGVLPVRPMHAVTAEIAAGTAVLGTSFLGAPVSMTQAVAGALVGAGVSEGPRRVRWRTVINIAVAWVVTLPAALLIAAAVAYVLEVAR